MIKYDKHVKNLIPELSKSGHVTHTRYKKKSVTFHHNAGVNISHEGILRLWTTRPASAHFDVDKDGDVAQYVEVDEYAWAVGNTEGNEETISIELTNSTVGPHWEVSETTWKSGARLAGWLFANEIRENPTKHNVFPHHHWSATTCPGPYIDRIFDDILNEVQHWYNHFTKADEPTPHPHHKGNDVGEVKDIQRAVGLKGKDVDGLWGDQTDKAVLEFRKRHHNKF